MQTMVDTHQFVKHTMTPVSVLPDDDGAPIVFVDPEQALMAEEAAVYGCTVCGMGADQAMHEECPGVPIDDL